MAEAADWYEAQRAGRGATFLARVAETIAAIRVVPRAFTPVRGDYRRAVVRHFPYIVVYRHDEEAGAVTVYAVFHTSQDPSKLFERLPEKPE